MRWRGGELAACLRAHGVSVYLSELLADPPPGTAGDANGDGRRETYGDEFAEIANGGPDPVDLAGWRLGDDDASPASWFAFPPLLLAPAGRTVLFGGGAPVGLPGPAFADDGRIGDGLANPGDVVILVTARGDTADVAAGAGWGDGRSRVRGSPRAPLIAHGRPPGAGEPFSPGRDGDDDRGAPRRVLCGPDRRDPRRSPPPDGDAGDANGDGVRNAWTDEYIEILNTGADTVAVGGWSLGDDDARADSRFRFPAGVLLAPGQRAVLFGGGLTRVAGLAFADDGRIGNGLANGGDGIRLTDAAGAIVDAVDGAGWPEDCAGAQCPWRLHDDPEVSPAALSPGASARRP